MAEQRLRVLTPEQAVTDVGDPASDLGVALSATIVAAIADIPPAVIGPATGQAMAQGQSLKRSLAALQTAGVADLTVGSLAPYGNVSSQATLIDSAATLTVAGPHYVTTATAHGLAVNDAVGFGTITGATGVVAGLAYYVFAVISTTVVQIKANLGDTGRKQWSVDGSGSLYKKWPITENAWDFTNTVANPLIQFDGARPVQAGTSGPSRGYAKADPTSLTYAPGTLTGPSLWSHTLMTGTKLDLILINNLGYPTRIYVDGVLVKTLVVADFTAASITNGSPGRLPITFATAGLHDVAVEIMQGSFGGFDRPQTDHIGLPMIPAGQRILFVGDSYGEGGSAGDTGIPFVSWCARLLGWRDLWRACAGSTGYLTDGTRTALIDRWQNDIVAQAPDVVVLSLGINDSTQTAADIAAAAATIIDGTTAALPNAVIIVVGPWSPRGVGYIAGYLPTLNTALKAVADARGLKYIDPISEGWITGNGYDTATTGKGNSDLFISSDGTHPTPAGHEYLGWRLAGHLALV